MANLNDNFLKPINYSNNLSFSNQYLPQNNYMKHKLVCKKTSSSSLIQFENKTYIPRLQFNKNDHTKLIKSASSSFNFFVGYLDKADENNRLSKQFGYFQSGLNANEANIESLQVTGDKAKIDDHIAESDKNPIFRIETASDFGSSEKLDRLSETKFKRAKIDTRDSISLIQVIDDNGNLINNPNDNGSFSPISLNPNILFSYDNNEYVFESNNANSEYSDMKNSVSDCNINSIQNSISNLKNKNASVSSQYLKSFDTVNSKRSQNLITASYNCSYDGLISKSHSDSNTFQTDKDDKKYLNCLINVNLSANRRYSCINYPKVENIQVNEKQKHESLPELKSHILNSTVSNDVINTADLLLKHFDSHLEKLSFDLKSTGSEKILDKLASQRRVDNNKRNSKCLSSKIKSLIQFKSYDSFSKVLSSQPNSFNQKRSQINKSIERFKEKNNKFIQDSSLLVIIDQLSNPVKNNNDKTPISRSSIELNNENSQNYRFDSTQRLSKTSNKEEANSKSTSYLDSLFKKNSSSNMANISKQRVKFSLYNQDSNNGEESPSCTDYQSKQTRTISSVAKDIKSKASNLLLKRRHTEASIIEKGLLPPRDEIYKWQTSFENLLRHKYGLALFRGFLKTEFSDENIEFWLECEDYKYTNKEAKRQAKSKKIYSDFVATGSPKEVNLEIEIRNQTAKNILNPTHDTFDRAQKRIFTLMEKDSYPRFLESDLYKNLLAAYPTITNSSKSSEPTKNFNSLSPICSNDICNDTKVADSFKDLSLIDSKKSNNNNSLNLLNKKN